MKNKLFTLAGTITVLAVLGHFYAKPLIAQVRAVLTKNLDERGRNPYTGNANCVAVQGGGCQLTFPAVPAKMRLVIEHVDIFLQADSTIGQATLYGGIGAYHPIFQTIPVVPDADYVNSVVSQTMLAYFEAGQSPVIRAYSLSGNPLLGGGGNITGYFVDLSE